MTLPSLLSPASSYERAASEGNKEGTRRVSAVVGSSAKERAAVWSVAPRIPRSLLRGEFFPLLIKKTKQKSDDCVSRGSRTGKQTNRRKKRKNNKTGSCFFKHVRKALAMLMSEDLSVFSRWKRKYRWWPPLRGVSECNGRESSRVILVKHQVKVV